MLEVGLGVVAWKNPRGKELLENLITGYEG